MEDPSYSLLILSVLGSLLGFIYIYFKYSYTYWKKKGVKYVEPSFPLGNCKDIILMRQTMGDVYEDCYKKLKGEKYGGIYQLHKPQLLVRDPEIIKAILVKDFEHFHDHAFIADESFDPLSGNLFMLTGFKWKDLRTKLSPTFTSGKLKMMFQTLAECGVELQEYLKKPAELQEIFEIKDVMAKFTTDIIASCAFGIQCNCLKDPDAEFRKWGKKLLEPNFNSIWRGLLYLLAPSIAIKLKIPNTPNDVTTFFRTMVNETVSFREKHSVSRKDFLQLLIQLKDMGDNKGLSMDEMAAQVFVFFIGGFETSSTTMSFCLYELALNQDVQQRLRIEIDDVLNKHDGQITYEAIQEMQYLDNVVSETLRKYPPVSFLSRDCTKDYRLPGTDIILEKGTDIVIPNQALQFDPQYFPDPDKFDPDRFNEEIKNKRPRFTYLPFGEGPRICIGMRFGLMQTKVGLVNLLKKYKFHVCNKTCIPLVKDPKQFITCAKEGIWLQIKNRSKTACHSSEVLN